jgi:hypothetical protein
VTRSILQFKREMHKEVQWYPASMPDSVGNITPSDRYTTSRCQCIKYMKQTYLYMSTSICNASFTHFILLAAPLIEHNYNYWHNNYIVGSTLKVLWYYCSKINMAARLAVCTKETQHAVFQFLWAESTPGAEIHPRL